ncbi:MAG: hypothetical protein A3B86_00335 [Candidatus Yanofskybacteria bacterium RIFCSPHIGHO2_02_FULL_38_22b]|uniref:Uncharacterized protein n=1 Tax=Candidatus Yanofskybacteria bacterium RIFCSPHIGHO2_02_FULL_38_22b TaxID=1802673 RepID=A0A1F8F1R2_9BACT|nr:MAG: hypothetical protein A2816_02810 [Candidatus Yanofskybacteria bacterium RIFCSPHIGHO2_01_FULL_39_44]OGN06628.1 MAG: hypothetical protein A3B86_00335 [Candidatus Yanofskybacteria bacterium RIFCSPHIGHO2_02_FULL_38_22b]OGN20558.1 MAG: hypothetical protein A2910_01720 [Candidatus Yanofskybacteria bacterium RIFCSPLOWO2_01_FULL_39_28]
MLRKKDVPIIIVSLVAVGLIASIIGTPFLIDYLKYDSYDKDDFIDPNTYQALFLTNNQTYFGSLANINSDYLVLSDVYYVKVNEETGEGRLVKLGPLEPHKPNGSMIINKDQVLFWENLNFDSSVLKTIQQNMKQNN